MGAEAQQKQKQFVGKPRTAWQKKQKRYQERVQNVALGTLSQREELLQAMKTYDMEQIIAIYASLPDKKPLTPADLTALAQCVHQCLRLETYKASQSKKQEDTEQIVAFATQLVKDIRKGRLFPSIYAHVHLLGTFRESGTHDAGVKFWDWLQAQDEEYVNPDVYAAAIDLLARTGTSRAELEQLYLDALARFPGTFNAYHLSPDAILANRDQEFGVKGVPMSLLLSITVARLLAGDSHKAYLALDTAFRLYPTTVPTRFFASFKDERPVSEYYTVFAMACRAGIQLPGAYYKELIMRLRKSSDLKSVSVHMSVIRAMLAATRLQIGINGTIHNNAVNELSITIIQTLRLSALSVFDREELKSVADDVVRVVKTLLQIFARCGASPGEAVFNSIITNVGGFCRHKNAIGTALADMRVLGISPSEITRRSTLMAAGMNQDADLVQEAWRDIVQSRQRSQALPDLIDLHVLVTAAHHADLVDFAKEQFETLKDGIDTNQHEGLEVRFTASPAEVKTSNVSSESISQILADLDGLKNEVANLDSATQDRASMQDLNGRHLPMALIPPPDWLRLSHDDMRDVYDELTTEQKPVKSPADNRVVGAATFSEPPSNSKDIPLSRGPVSTTNIPLGSLRFQNWDTINYLLWLSKKHDQDYEASVDRAISAGETPPRRQRGFAKDELIGMKPLSFEEMRPAAQRESPVYYARLYQAKSEIYRLRDKETTQ